MPQLKPPPCHWTGCAWFGRPMKLMAEKDGFAMFFCECGCTRAISLPSTRAASLYIKYERDLEEIRARQKFLASRPEYSLPSAKKEG